MLQLSGNMSFVVKSLNRLKVVAMFQLQTLKNNVASHLRIVSGINDSHSALSQLALNRIASCFSLFHS